MKLAPGPAAFGAAVLLHAVFVTWLGHPWPGGLRADENVYLELAQHLWRDGRYGSQVSVTYPPLYPLFAAPAFALASNTARFTALYAAHAFALGLASLTLLPALKEQLGQRAWWALAMLQFFGGATHVAQSTQSEALFVPLLVAAAGIASRLGSWRTSRWAALGLLCGLAISTRRMAVVMPMAAGLIWLVRLWESRDLGAALRVLPAAVAGGLLGLLPELVLTLFRGEVADPYGGPAAAGHLGAASLALASPANLIEAVRTTARHAAYVVVSTGGAPLLLGWALFRRDAPRTLRLGGAFALLVSLGLQALTVLHILRYRLKRPGAEGWDLYPRYVDPGELPLVVFGALAAGWLVARVDPSRRARVGGVLAAGTVALAAIAGPLGRVRGGRWILPRRLPLMGVPSSWEPWLLLALAVAVAGTWWWLWRAGRLRPLVAMALALAVSLGISAHTVVARVAAPPRDPMPRIYRHKDLAPHPRAPVAVVVHHRGPDARRYYEPAFRSDHPVWFLSPRELGGWRKAHPDGFVLIHRSDRKRKPRPPGRAARAASWWAYPPEASLGTKEPPGASATRSGPAAATPAAPPPASPPEELPPPR